MSTGTRLEHDAMGDMAVANSALWGAQTQRSLLHFHVSSERMPHAVMRAMVQIKQVAAQVHAQLGLLGNAKAQAIAQAAQEVLDGQHADAFPLSVWQTGSGTQSHMNVNEVLANRASELMGGGRGSARLVHPNDDVNLGQSSNDVFPTAMHMATLTALKQSLLPSLQALQATLAAQSRASADVTKVGRTHLQDAVPLSLGQEMSGWVAQLGHAQRAIEATLAPLCELVIGGTAVGNGLNTDPRFGAMVSAALATQTGLPLVCAANRYAGMAAHDALVSAHGSLKTLSVALMKIANDVRWMASGPRCGLGEMHLPDNEPGSSMMPGKVNPTQCEALTMVCCQVMGNDVAMSLAGASGQFELNAYKPLMVHGMLQSTRLLADAMHSFDTHCAQGMRPDRAHLAAVLGQSLVWVTALAPHLGHERAAQVLAHAQAQGGSLRDAAIEVGGITADQFDAWTRLPSSTPDLFRSDP
jgi:fumarate hydratase, class II